MDDPAITNVTVEISVVLGHSMMAIHQLLKMGRGAVIELDTTVNDPVSIYANEQLVARGEVMVVENHIGVTITDTIVAPTD
jgi:flagellar motor switch protein FliN/FliY